MKSLILIIFQFLFNLKIATFEKLQKLFEQTKKEEFLQKMC